MKVDIGIKGILRSLLYFVAGAYAWIENTGLSAYVLTSLALFMGLDMVLGWIKASVVVGLDNPSSKKAKKGILVKSVIFVIPVVVGIIWGALGDTNTAIKVVNVQLTGLLIAEGYSIIGNAYAIYTKEELSEFDAITFIFKKTGSSIRKLLDKVIGDS